MRCTCSSALLLLAACTIPPPTHPRPPLPLPVERTAVPVPELVARTRLDNYRERGELRGAGETVAFELWRETQAPSPRPVVLLVPILAGGENLMATVAEAVFARGYDVAWCQRVGRALAVGDRARELQELLRRTVLQQRLTLAWLRSGIADPPPALFVLGISLGGIVATDVAALEPGLTGAAVCLAGGDLPRLVTSSDEGRVRRWVEWRQREDGVSEDHLQWELAQWLRYEPVSLAQAVATPRVLFVSARFDAVVVPRQQDLLWEALGRPQRYTVPLGHYSAAIALWPIVAAATDHFDACARAAAPH
ncbi:MAG: hypothetical protein U1E73_07205 [Planctomycetota bacterium]